MHERIGPVVDRGPQMLEIQHIGPGGPSHPAQDGRGPQIIERGVRSDRRATAPCDPQAGRRENEAMAG